MVGKAFICIHMEGGNMNSYMTKDGVEVVVADGVSHSHRDDLNEEVISKLVAGDQPFIRETISPGRIIGKDHLVERGDDDDLYFHSRNGNEHKSVFALNREAVDTDKATVVIAKGGPEDGELEGKMVLVTLFEGDPGMPEPYGRNDTEECRAFWETHALVPTEKERLEIADEMERNAEDQHVFDTENVRVFILDGKHPEDSFFSPYTGSEMAAIVSLDAETKRIRISVSGKRDDISAEIIASAFRGGGFFEVSDNSNVVLSPAGREMGAGDLVVAAISGVEKLIMLSRRGFMAMPGARGRAVSLTMSEARELTEMRNELRNAISGAVSERGLDIKDLQDERGIPTGR